MSQSNGNGKRLFEVLHELVLRRQSGEITEEEMSRLRELLRNSSQARRLYVEYIYESVGIAALSESGTVEDGLAKGQPITEPVSAPVVKHTLIRQGLDRIRGFVAQPTPFSLSVAAVVVCLIVGLMAITAAPFYRALTRRPTPPIVEQSPDVVARITGTHRIEWSAGTDAPTGTSILLGRRLEIEAGLLELTFADGAVSVLQGPAVCIVETKDRLSLRRGRLVANVPEAAIGFTVSTPALDIVDLGTEFGVEVAEDGSGEVHVLQGRVELKNPTLPDSTGRVLAPGEAWKFTPQGNQQQLAKSDAQRFAFSVPKPQVAVFQNGQTTPGGDAIYNGVDDVMVIEWARDNNFGLRPDFDVGQNDGKRAHTLLRFDLSALEGKAERILSVTIVITPNDRVAYFPWGNPGNIEVYRVSDENASWAEGISGAAGDPGVKPGDVSWNRLHHPDAWWIGKHGAALPGVDYDSQPLASEMFAPRTAYPLRFKLGGDLQFIHEWTKGGLNGGFLLRETIGDEQNRINFHSSESNNVAARPKLIIQYLPLEQPTTKEQDRSP